MALVGARLHFCYLFYGAKERTWERGWGHGTWAFFTIFLVMEAPTHELLAKLKPAGPRNIIFEAESPFVLVERAPKSPR